MKILSGGCRIFDGSDGQLSTVGSWTSRALISRSTGACHITQSISEYESGRSPALVNPGAEEVLYVATGAGVCWIDGFAYDLRPGTGVYIPRGAVYWIENTNSDALRIVHACCPEDPQRHLVDVLPTAIGEPPKRIVHEEDREIIRAGKDREFRYLVHTDLGCRQITQFVGTIPPSIAPFHHHEYEEGIFILEGDGRVHVDGEKAEFGPGASIYFPIGVRHCVENNGHSRIRLLGAFYPSGSPGAAYED